MSHLRFATVAVLGLPLFALAACNHDARTQPPRIDAGPDSWTIDFSTGSNVATAGSDVGPDGRAVDLDKGGDGPPDVPSASFDAGLVDVSPPPGDVPAIDGPLPALLTVDPTSARLEVIFVGSHQQATPAVFRVQNGGDTTTGPLQIASAGPNASYFKIVNDTCSGVSLPPQQGCTVGAVWTPFSMGSPATGMLLATDTASGKSVTATLTGTSLAGDCFSVRESRVDLGSVLPGATGATVPVTVENFCDFGVDTVSTDLTGRDLDKVRVSIGTCTTLGPKSTCVLGVQLAPSINAKAGTIAATLTVTSSESGQSIVVLVGTILADANPGIDGGGDADEGAVDTSP